MATIIVCTPGGASDNCYVTLLQANTYFSLGLRNDNWLHQWSDDDRERALIDATATLEELGGPREAIWTPARPLFPGRPYHDGTTNGVALQALHFPTQTDATTISGVLTLKVPEAVKAAVCEQAYWALEKRDAPDLVDRRELQAQGVKSLSVDGIAENYGQATVPAGIAPLAWGRMKAYTRQAFGIM